MKKKDRQFNIDDLINDYTDEEDDEENEDGEKYCFRPAKDSYKRPFMITKDLIL